jgi:Helix-turn-helix domain
MPTDSTTRQSRQANQAKTFTKQKFAFLGRLAADRELPPRAAAIGIVLVEHFNHKHGGAAWPSCRTIAAAIGADKATVLRTLRAMEKRGHLRVEWGSQGSGHVSKYWMADAEKVQQRTFKGAEKGASVSRKGAGLHQNPFKNPLMASSKEEAKEGEREALSRSPLHDARAFEGARIIEEESKKRTSEVAAGKKENNTSETGATNGSDVVPLSANFETLQAVWLRPWPDAECDDRAAFTNACREADPADIIEAAKTWVAAADAPRFLPPLAKWLNGRGWLKVPPARRQHISGHRNGRKVDTAAMMLAMANQFELEEAGQ